MSRTFQLGLNQFALVPSGLREDPKINRARIEVPVDLRELFHHYYWDSHGLEAPDPNPAFAYYAAFLTPGPEFRYLKSGMGSHAESKRNSSNPLGKAVCRYMLRKYLGINYFAHMDHVLDKKLPPGFDGLAVRRLTDGDTPDYICAKDVKRVFAAEAKGRQGAISFKSTEFRDWRAQFNTIEFRQAGRAVSVKGFIVAARFVSEAHPKTKSTILVEDPSTPGEPPLRGSDIPRWGRRVVQAHYGPVFARIGQPAVSNLIRDAARMPADDRRRFTLFAWTCTAGPLAGRRFVGGHYLPEPLRSLFMFANAILGLPPALDSSRLSGATFVGLELGVAVALLSSIRGDVATLDQVEPMVWGGDLPPQMSALPDGTVIGAVEYFRPDGPVEL